MSAPAPIAAAQSGLSDASGAVAEVLGDVVSTGVVIARDIVGTTSGLADDLFHSAAGALGLEKKRSNRSVFSKLVVALAALAVLAVVVSLVRRMRGGSQDEVASTFPSPASVREAAAGNGTKDRTAAPVS